MMTQPIQNFQDLTSETAPAGGNTKRTLPFEDRRRLEVRARYARAEFLADGLVDAILWFGRRWRRLVDGVKTEFRLRAAEAELRGMSDRELTDIGLARSEIGFAVRHAVHGLGPQVDGCGASAGAVNENLRRAA